MSARLAKFPDQSHRSFGAIGAAMIEVYLTTSGAQTGSINGDEGIMLNLKTQPRSLKSDDLLARAARVIPGGASAAGRRVFREVIVKTQGAYVWNAEGKRFIDYLLDYGPIVLGHSDPNVNAAVKRTADTCDLNWVGAHPLEVELAEKIVSLVPSAEKVAFVTSGSDALLHALHIARAHTGRRKVLKFHGSFVGWQDALAKGANFDVQPGHVPGHDDPNSGGLSSAAMDDVIVLDWNDADGVRTAFAREGREIAALICEPYLFSYGCVAPAPGFLELLRELTQQHGALLIFDEVKTGFRLHLGGYQAICGVTPDLSAFGKAMGNGFTVAALAGRGDLMDLLGTAVALDGTHYANPYALAAARETVRRLESGALDRINSLGAHLRAGLADAAKRAGAAAVITGIGSAFMVNWLPRAPVTFSDAARADFTRAEAFRVKLLESGVLMPPFVITEARLCAQLSEVDVENTVRSAYVAFKAVA